MARRALMAALPVALAACSMMTDDRSSCPVCDNTLHVVLRYDYNMERANMLDDQARQATVYVVDDKTGRVADQMTTRRAPADAHAPFAFTFSDLPAGTYRLYATAASPATPGAQPAGIAATPATGDDMAALSFSFPHPASAALLDTLWNTLHAQTVTLTGEDPAEATVPLMRLTKNLSITLIQTQNPADCRAEDYDVSVSCPQWQFAHDNTPAEAATPTIVTPYDQATVATLADGAAEPTARNAHYDLSLPRLMAHDLSQQNARLKVTHKADAKDVIDIDLLHYLAIARTAAGRNYPLQEFLDREHNYHLDIVLVGSEWSYMMLSVSVLSWAIRIDNESL